MLPETTSLHKQSIGSEPLLEIMMTGNHFNRHLVWILQFLDLETNRCDRNVPLGYDFFKIMIAQQHDLCNGSHSFNGSNPRTRNDKAIRVRFHVMQLIAATIAPNGFRLQLDMLRQQLRLGYLNRRITEPRVCTLPPVTYPTLQCSVPDESTSSTTLCISVL
jgi:hypothetical protein